MARHSFTSLIVALAWAGMPAPAVAQAKNTGISIEGAIGTSLRSGGHNESIAAGFSLGGRLTLLGGAERLYWPTERDDLGATRGGTVTFVSGALRVTPTPQLSVAPYAIVGVGRGVSRPNVNDLFPTPVRNDATLAFFGGGIRIAATDHVGVIADVRAGLLGESDSLALLLPAHVGVTWTF